MIKRNFNKVDLIFFRILKIFGYIFILFFVIFFFTLFLNALPVFKKFGLNFIVSKKWDPYSNEFGILPFIIGTIYTSFLAILISLPFSLSISIFLGEYFKKGWLFSVLSSLIDLLAGIPSVIYGFWALFVLVPLVRELETKIGITPYGVGIFSASLVLAIMIIPYASSIGREVISLVPSDIKEAAYALGATRFEVVRYVILPYAKSGIIAGIILALGRAIGETMAVTMVIGNVNELPKTIFSPSNTMASVIANEFAEATGDLYLSALIGIGLILFVITALTSFLGRLVIKKLEVR